jgi:hypothetical protein
VDAELLRGLLERVVDCEPANLVFESAQRLFAQPSMLWETSAVH